MIQTTLIAWTRIFQTKGIDDPEHDPARIAAGFDRIAGDITAWPAPKQVLDAMPERPRPYFHKLPAPEQTAEDAEADRQRRHEVVDRERIRLAGLIAGHKL